MVGRPSDGVNSSRGRALLGVTAWCFSSLAVAVASTGSVPAGTGGTRAPSDRFLDVVISLVLVWMAFGAGHGRRPPAAAQGRRRRDRRHPAEAQPLGDVRRRSRSASACSRSSSAVVWVDGGPVQAVADRLRPGSRGSTDATTPAPGTYEPEFATGPVLIVLGLLVVAIATWVIAYRARRRRLGPMEESLAARARRRAGRDARRPPGRVGPAPGGHRRVRPDGARARRLRASRATRPRRRTSTCSASSPTST